MKYFLSIVLLLSANFTIAQRMVLPWNKDWQFSKDNISFKSSTSRWQKVNLPHTWNVQDVMDDEPGYYRGPGWYKKILKPDQQYKGKKLYLLFEGANQTAEVFVNGKKATQHTGGYTAFPADITSLVNFGGDNEILVKVNNSHDKNIPPLTADFTFYGGIYRDVNLIVVDPVHFSFDKNGSKGLFVSAPEVNKETATVHVKSIIVNKDVAERQIAISSIVYDRNGKEVGRVNNNVVVKKGAEKITEQTIGLSKPKLWSPAEPYLYKVVTSIINTSSGKSLDEIASPLGLRWFRFDAKKGFYLNGEPLKLVGASRHQDYAGLGNAVPDFLARRDVELLKGMGGNILRVAHYPQDPAVLQACDELGLLASVEIPLVNEITETDSFYSNCLLMQDEMIDQHYNHPSVIMWCYMNEILLRPAFVNDKERQKIYFANITRLARSLDSLTRKKDPGRYTMIAHHGNYSLYSELRLIDIPMVVGWNLYAGWYGANIKDFPAFLDRFHNDYPAKPVMVTEYGADADPRISSDNPLRFDKSVEYATAFHQYYLPEILKRPFVSGAMVWNLADFNSETRRETMPHINNKGLLRWDRKPKDPYFYYKAMLSTKPFIKILGTGLRVALADSGSNMSVQKISVAGNVNEIALFINGVSQKTKPVENGIATWTVSFKNGNNHILVKAIKDDLEIKEEAIINCRLQPNNFTKGLPGFQQLNVLLGANRYFTDSCKVIWQPSQEYRIGSWGHIGGRAFKLPKGQMPYGTDKNIAGTPDDPVYQTQQVGLTSYKIDVPDGNYELVLHFAELLGGEVQGMIYNLDSSARTETDAKRIFNVVMNDKPVLLNFNIAEYGRAIPVIKKLQLATKNGKGITINFQAIEGEPVLNALQLKKVK